ncbi:MAG: class I SAM-dependent rRNA methyltransferase, partial [Legionella sp.]
MNAKVILLAAKQNTVLRGHPWVFPKAIARIVGKPKTGHLVDVYSEADELLAVGAYNEHSLYRVRILALSNEAVNPKDYQSIISYRLEQAKKVRLCLGLPNEDTTAYRLFNSEADGLSGLTIDRFNHMCVVSSTAYWVELNRELITEALAALYP